MRERSSQAARNWSKGLVHYDSLHLRLPGVFLDCRSLYPSDAMDPASVQLRPTRTSETTGDRSAVATTYHCANVPTSNPSHAMHINDGINPIAEG